MRWPNRDIFLTFLVLLFLSFHVFPQTPLTEQVNEDETRSRGNSQKVVEFGEDHENKLSIPQSNQATEKVRQKLNVEGIAIVDGAYSAVINDNIVSVGSVIEECQILGISWQGIIVEYEGYWVWIPMEAGLPRGD
jgi:hypothetical protein